MLLQLPDGSVLRAPIEWTDLSVPDPFRLGRVLTTEGNLAVAVQTVVLTVVATDRLHVSFNVPEGILVHLRRDGLAEPGRLAVAVGFPGDEGFPHAAALDTIEPEVAPRTGTVRFRAALPNPKGVVSPGMSARVRLAPAPR